MFIAEWGVEEGRTTKCDAVYASLPDRNLPDMLVTFQYLDRVIEYAENGRPLQDLYRERLIVNLRNKIRRRAYSRIPEIRDFARLSFNMPNNRPLDNEEFEAWLGEKGFSIPSDFPERFLKRNKHLIFVPQSNRSGKTVEQLRGALNTRIAAKGGDPYLGQPLAFDYIFCRLGPTTFERDVSLIVDLSVLKFEDMAKYHRTIWEKSPLRLTDPNEVKDIPTYTMYLKEGSAQVLKNVLRIYAFASDVIIYGDAMIYF